MRLVEHECNGRGGVSGVQGSPSPGTARAVRRIVPRYPDEAAVDGQNRLQYRYPLLERQGEKRPNPAHAGGYRLPRPRALAAALQAARRDSCDVALLHGPHRRGPRRRRQAMPGRPRGGLRDGGPAEGAVACPSELTTRPGIRRLVRGTGIGDAPAKPRSPIASFGRSYGLTAARPAHRIRRDRPEARPDAGGSQRQVEFR